MTRRARYRCAACDRPLKSGRGRPCVADCGARLCRTPRHPHCTDVHASQCPNYQPLEPPVPTGADCISSAYGVVVAAIRDDIDGVMAAFNDLTPEETTALATAAVLGLAVVIRNNFEPHHVDDLIAAVQTAAAEDAAEAA